MFLIYVSHKAIPLMYISYKSQIKDTIFTLALDSFNLMEAEPTDSNWNAGGWDQ